MRWIFLTTIALALAPLSYAQTVRNYEYDALGRLIKVTPSSGNAVCYKFDRADNRTDVTSAATCSAAPTPHPPTAVADYEYAANETNHFNMEVIVDVLWNDTDPDFPNDTLTITTVTGSFTIVNNKLRFYGHEGTFPFTYTIKDSTNLTSSVSGSLEVIWCGPGGC